MPTDQLTDTERKQMATELSTQLATSLAPSSGPLSLYRIEAEMAELAEAYREALYEGDEAGAVAIREQLQKYVAAEVQKVDNCAGIIRYAKDIAARFTAEIDRLKKAELSWSAVEERVKAMVLEVMQATEQKKLQGRYSTFRVQKNSQDAVIVDNPAIVPEQYLRVTVSMSLATWKSLRDEQRYIALLEEKGIPEVSLSRIKAALEANVVVPGARLQRGEHLRIE